MLRLAVVGLGKMGLSHHAIINMHPDVKVVAVCDASAYVLDVLHKYTGIKTYTHFDAMQREEALDAVVIATPPKLHGPMVRAALERGWHVFCEKPFNLDPKEGEELAALANARGLVNQVGYHNRFVGTFHEVKRLLDLGAIGEVVHVMAEAYGPVVLKPKGSTWRTEREAGGGCLYDYAAHPLNLVNWYLGMPTGVGGAVLNGVFSKETDDVVFGTLFFEGSRSAQISVNWTDESYRKMTTRITISGTAGRIYADRQEVQVYLRDTAKACEPYKVGWNVRYTTELTDSVWFYVRGEEYSAQLDHFVRCIVEKRAENRNSFADAAQTDRVIAMMIAAARKGASVAADAQEAPEPARQKRRGILSLFGPS
jgi:predicted dehydrogenase